MVNGKLKTISRTPLNTFPIKKLFTLPVAEPKSSTVKGFLVMGAIENPYKVVGGVGFVLMASPTSLLTQFCHSF